MRLADCGDGVWVGGYLACDANPGRWDRVVHVWKPADLASGLLCRCCREVATGAGVHHLVVTYEESRPLETAAVPVPAIVAHCRKPGTVLCHCSAGSCRGPTMAVLAKVARGVDLGRALADVVRAVATYDANPLNNGGLPGILAVADNGRLSQAALSP